MVALPEFKIATGLTPAKVALARQVREFIILPSILPQMREAVDWFNNRPAFVAPWDNTLHQYLAPYEMMVMLAALADQCGGAHRLIAGNGGSHYGQVCWFVQTSLTDADVPTLQLFFDAIREILLPPSPPATVTAAPIAPGDYPIDLLTGRQTAEALGICEKTLWSLRKQGRIAAVPIGTSVRYSKRDVLAFIEATKSAGQQDQGE